MHWHIRDIDGIRLSGHYATAKEADKAVDWLLASGQYKEGELIVFSCSVPTYHGWC